MSDPARVHTLERANYAALAPISAVTPGLELILRDDIILTSSAIFPTPDTTHACSLQSSAAQADSLIDEAMAYFASRQLPTTFYLSPACTPADLPQRLTARGFVMDKHPESWVVLDDLERIQFRSERSDVSVKPITPAQTEDFAETFLLAFDMPVEFAGMLADLLRPSIGLPIITHYLATIGDERAGTISLTQYEQYGIIGSAGVVPHHRSARLVIELFRAIYTESRQKHITTLLAQTRMDSTAEQLLLANHFQRVFARHAYTLSG